MFKNKWTKTKTNNNRKQFWEQKKRNKRIAKLYRPAKIKNYGSVLCWFGKYAGKPYDDIPLYYLQWVVEQSWNRGRMRQTVEKLKEYIRKYRTTDTSCHHEENAEKTSQIPSSVIADKISAESMTKHD
jgi:uncharacterized protein (DUF3820 family)